MKWDRKRDPIFVYSALHADILSSLKRVWAGFPAPFCCLSNALADMVERALFQPGNLRL